ncbi:MAG: amidohydrolase family protein [Nitrospinaceae bacterium]|nr:amidohydrolase family protein [Nitrospina sp.]MBT5376708.1 amidohydrolase family protein [Nitrospinaceae bacterium]MBT5868905.1 amidohydrolase family protein [Nitrospinaceae bacterium]MBT6345888.1 amidohydrolase family protein [Nitrospina sp.]
MVLKIKFRALLTLAGDSIENGELTIDDGRVVAISTSSTGGVDVLDLSDCLLMPGFVNAHCHLSLTALKKKLTPAVPFIDWLQTLIPLNANLDDSRRLEGIHAGADQMKRSGVTALGDYIADPELLGVIGGLGFRSVLFLETLGFNSAGAQSLCNKVEAVLQETPPSSLSRWGLAPHAPYSVSPDLFRCLRQLAQKYQCPLSCHVAEIQEEVAFLNEGNHELQELLKERSVWDAQWQTPRKTPVQYLNSLDALNSLIAIHCNFVSADLGLMAEKKVSAVFCPQSTSWFGRNEFMPVREMLDLGITVALGTDSLASNDSLNFLEELRAADKLLPDVSRSEILNMATRLGGEALGLQSGHLACGQNADLIGFRVSPSYSGSWWDVPFEPDRREVDFYMVDGKPDALSSC